MKAVIPLTALAIFLLNTSLSKGSFVSTKEKILAAKNFQENHLYLSHLFILNNQFGLAETEVLTVLTSSTDAVNKSGVKDKLRKVTKLKNQESEIVAEIRFWTSLVNTHPFYRDAYIKTAILFSKQRRLFEAKKYIENASLLDKNNQIIKEFQKSISDPDPKL